MKPMTSISLQPIDSTAGFPVKRSVVASALAMALLLPNLASATNGYFSHGYGQKSAGMAGVGVALPQDALAAATNPAGAAWIGDRLDVGLTWFRPTRGAEVTAPNPTAGNLDGNGKTDFILPEFGYNRTLGNDRAVGLVVYGNGGMNTQYNSGVPLFGSSQAGVDLSQLFIAPTYAFKPVKDHALGISLDFAYQRFKAEGLENFANPMFSSAAGSVTNQGYDSATGWGVHLGYTGKLSEQVTVGATWRSKIRMGKFDKYKGLFAEQGGFDIPEQFGIGIAVKPVAPLTVAFDVQRIKYGAVRSIGNTLDGLFTAQLGNDGAAGFGWQDITVYKLGLAYEVSKSLTVRGGYSHSDQPIPSSQTLFNILAPGVIQDHLSLGATWATSPTTELTVGYTHGFKKTVNGSNSIPAAFGGGEANIHLEEDMLGVAFGWKL